MRSTLRSPALPAWSARILALGLGLIVSVWGPASLLIRAYERPAPEKQHAQTQDAKNSSEAPKAPTKSAQKSDSPGEVPAAPQFARGLNHHVLTPAAPEAPVMALDAKPVSARGPPTASLPLVFNAPACPSHGPPDLRLAAPRGPPSA